MADVLAELKALLWEWDPIVVKGYGAPPTEYDAYAPELLVLLRRAESLDNIQTYLDWLECQWIGLSRSGGRTADIAHRAKKIYSWKSTI